MERAVSARVVGDYIEVALEDGRIVKAPLSLYPSVWALNPRERRDVVLLPGGSGVAWPTIDLQVSVTGIVEGRREHRAPSNFGERLAAIQARMRASTRSTKRAEQ